MTESRAQLLARKRDVFAAIRLLERDHQDGVIGSDEYQISRDRFEQQAAGVLERLDALSDDSSEERTGDASARPTVGRFRPWLFGLSGALAIVALGFILVPALHVRSGNAAITGDLPTVSPTPFVPTRRVLEAQQEIAAHPRSDLAYIQLGNAYLQAGQVDAADASYRRAMTLSPQDPQPITLHAVLIGTAGQRTRALQLIHQVERAHPAYSRAWLVDGLLSPSRRHDHRASIRAWRHFLRIDPSGRMATQVRQWVATAQKADRTRP